MNTQLLDKLVKLDVSARFEHGAEPIVAQSMQHEGKVFTVAYHVVNRKCYDGLSTSTASYKIDGKRVSKSVFYSAANN